MSSQTERDRSTDALLKASLPGLLPGETSACVDAETLAAWSERAMPTSDAARIDAHLAGCARCQAMLAAFVRTEPVAAAGVPFWQRWPALKWLVPAATVAGAVVIVSVVTRETAPVATPVQMARQEAPSAPAPPTAAPAPDASNAPPAAGVRQEFRQAAAPPGEALSRTGDQAAGSSARVDREARTNEMAGVAALPAPMPTAAPPASPPVAARRDLAQEPPRKTDEAQALPVPTQADAARPPGDQTPARSRDVTFTTQGQSTAGTSSQTAGAANVNQRVLDAATAGNRLVVAEVISAPPPVFAAPAGRGAAGRGRAGAAQAAESAAAASTLANTIPARWRVFSAGQVERSTNGGSTWRPVTIDTPVPLVGGTSPSDLVCWLIGPAGVVLLSVDGVRFERLRFPVDADLASITAPNARRATIVTVDGRTFVTFDGGASWTKNP